MLEPEASRAVAAKSRATPTLAVAEAGLSTSERMIRQLSVLVPVTPSACTEMGPFTALLGTWAVRVVLEPDT